MNGLTKCGIFCYNGILFGYKKEQSTITCYTWKNLENNKVSERCQTQQTMYYIISFFNFLLYKRPLLCTTGSGRGGDTTALAPRAAPQTQSLPSKNQFHFHDMTRIGKSTEIQSRLMDARVWGDGGIESNLTMWVSLGSN